MHIAFSRRRAIVFYMGTVLFLGRWCHTSVLNVLDVRPQHPLQRRLLYVHRQPLVAGKEPDLLSLHVRHLHVLQEPRVLPLHSVMLKASTRLIQ